MAFEHERERIVTAMPETFLSIRHIGSTAVAGLAAKPIIDLLAGVQSLDRFDQWLPSLQALGYCYSPGGIAQHDQHRWVYRSSYGTRSHNLHVVVYEGHEWQARIRFCERLRQDAQVRRTYEALKRRLAAEFRHDRLKYNQGKQAFIIRYSAGDLAQTRSS